MNEPQKMVHLLWTQKKQRKFHHSLTDSASIPLQGEDLDNILGDYFNGSSVAREQLILNFLMVLGTLISRYLYHWPVTRRFLDEMVSSGSEAIVEVISNLTLEQLKEKSLFKRINGKIRHKIEIEINNLRGLVSAKKSKNFELEKDGKNPIYGNIVTNSFYADGNIDQQFDFIDIKDILDKIVETHQEKIIISEENWVLSDREVAEHTGIHRRQVNRIRSDLLNRLREELKNE